MCLAALLRLLLNCQGRITCCCMTYLKHLDEHLETFSMRRAALSMTSRSLFLQAAGCLVASVGRWNSLQPPLLMLCHLTQKQHLPVETVRLDLAKSFCCMAVVRQSCAPLLPKIANWIFVIEQLDEDSAFQYYPYSLLAWAILWPFEI